MDFFADLGYEQIPTTQYYIYRVQQRQAQMKGGDTEPRLLHTVEKLTNKGEIEKWQTKNYVA